MAVGMVIAVAAASGCARDSYLLVTLISADTTFSDVSTVDVTVSGVAGRDPVALPTYVPATPVSFGQPMTDGRVRFSVAFTPSVVGKVTLEVTVGSATIPCLGFGKVADVMISRGGTSAIEIQVHHTTGGACPGLSSGPDAGSDTGADADANAPPDSTSPTTFPGCDPTAPTACAAGQSCFVDCTTKATRCVAAGTHGPGESCTTANDCALGSQCFDLSTRPGCAAATRLCLPLCADDSQCGASPESDAASPPFHYPGGSCTTAVECADALTTTYKTCTFACDPRGTATKGCPSGLLCFLFHRATGDDGPDCGCREPTRTGTDGASCVSSASCAPGFVCNESNGTLACRRLCLLAGTGAGAGAGDAAVTPGSECGDKTCTPLSTNPTFGACL